jgi:hypothetical protein
MRKSEEHSLEITEILADVELNAKRITLTRNSISVIRYR